MFAQGCSFCPLPHTRLLVPRQLLASASAACKVLTFLHTHADATTLTGSDVLNLFAHVNYFQTAKWNLNASNDWTRCSPVLQEVISVFLFFSPQ